MQEIKILNIGTQIFHHSPPTLCKDGGGKLTKPWPQSEAGIWEVNDKQIFLVCGKPDIPTWTRAR